MVLSVSEFGEQVAEIFEDEKDIMSALEFGEQIAAIPDHGQFQPGSWFLGLGVIAEDDGVEGAAAQMSEGAELGLGKLVIFSLKMLMHWNHKYIYQNLL